ncbi:uncharacterized protein A1O9_00167 [Exophiala aquamarina CBS 119918]|uniref:Kinetochore protein Mis13/DSN1 n=1 Tax=Exophiala aquamarina CBS 119918 TaxID=1182545 RepID=A0A072Q2R9_9EURO|nr:uncharacterized protein A1O9_00167 [Exophiala aquamarina CBS 119918]KEF62195.1 hypothetical protein A1O9_00167 [Exophiala aquamarina CBS 119918]
MSHRRISTRLQQKDDDRVSNNRVQVNSNVKPSKPTSESGRIQGSKSQNEKKRKMNYDEDDDGFLFNRVKKPKAPPQGTEETQSALSTQAAAPKSDPLNEKAVQPASEAAKAVDKKRRKRLSFSTPNTKADPSVRRSKRLSRENVERDKSPLPRVDKSAKSKQGRPPREPVVQIPTPSESQSQSLPPQTSQPLPSPNPQPPLESQSQSETETAPTQEADHSATKIALPFADTPVIKRNKAMREGKSGKGERRSSLGLRGRRASSLIETGNSNALPHNEVESPDFYKHIESEGLLEPRRMRQLLTWCATRVLDEKPMGTDFEDSSARSAARVIEEELLKDLANRSELSDWFSREDEPVQKKVLPERANPKNIQNAEKISELEVQIQRRLQSEKRELESLLRPPSLSLPQRQELNDSSGDLPDRAFISDIDSAALDSLQAQSTPSDQLFENLHKLYDSLEPTVDAFADGIHKIAQYRDAADNMAGRVLSICAEGLAKKDKEERKRALAVGEKTPPKDLSAVLRSLSRADR